MTTYNLWKIDTCDSCQDLSLTKTYKLDNNLFVWCDNCQDPNAIEQVA